MIRSKNIVRLAVLFLLAAGSSRGQPAEFSLMEATVQTINDAFDAGILTSEQLVQQYLDRIAAFDKQGPGINAILHLNPNALETARMLDEERRTTGPRSVLHGVPVLVKDNIDTFDMPTTAGSLSLRTSIPPDNAFIVSRLRDAGAIILGKTNLDEFAAGGTGVSSHGGQTRNPYDVRRIPGGSSAGSAAGIAANFATIAIGTDTSGSILEPSSLQSLVGLRPTMGLVSRDGIVPSNLWRHTM
jgi:amidase